MRTRHRNPNHRLLVFPSVFRAGIISLFPSEFWVPTKFCHGFQTENSGRLTISSSSPGIHVHIETICLLLCASHVSFLRPRTNHSCFPELGLSLLEGNGPWVGTRRPVNALKQNLILIAHQNYLREP